MCTTGQLQEDVLQIRLLGAEIDDRELRPRKGIQNLGHRALARTIAEQQAVRRGQFRRKAFELWRYDPQLGGDLHLKLFVVEPSQEPFLRLPGDDPAEVDDRDGAAWAFRLF